jgi:hypothetical protein
MPNPQAALRTLLGLKEPGRPGRIIVCDTGEISIGRAPENDLMLEDSDASRQHAVLVRSAQGFMLKDLGASNGTLVNDQPAVETVLLENKDVIKIGELVITFIQTRKDPVTLGLEVVYASQLKGFSQAANGADPGATTLGLTPNVAGAFDVGAVGDFGNVGSDAAIAPEPSPTRDLDLEFNDFVPGESKLPSASAAGDAVSLTLELHGLTPDLRRAVEGLLGKVIELPALRVRIKGE